MCVAMGRVMGLNAFNCAKVGHQPKYKKKEKKKETFSLELSR